MNKVANCFQLYFVGNGNVVFLFYRQDKVYQIQLVQSRRLKVVLRLQTSPHHSGGLSKTPGPTGTAQPSPG